METIYKGRKIVTEAFHGGTGWVIHTTIWPGSLEDVGAPRTLRTVGGRGQSDYEAQKMAIEATQKLIDDDSL